MSLVPSPNDLREREAVTYASMAELRGWVPEVADALDHWMKTHAEHPGDLYNPRLQCRWIRHEGSPNWSVHVFCKTCNASSAEFNTGSD